MSRVAVIQFFKDVCQDETKYKKLCHDVSSPAGFVEFANQYGYEFTEQELSEELKEVWSVWRRLEIPPGAGSSESLIRELMRLLKEFGKI